MTAAHPLTAAGLTLRVTLRTPALRWAAAVLVAVAGRCTVQARFESVPVVTPASVVLPGVAESEVEVVVP